MKIQWKTLAVCLALPLAVGLGSAFLTRDSMAAFGDLNQPPLSPPAWLFPVVWTILYLLMGAASYLIAISTGPKRAAWKAYGLQLFFNFFWSLIFFNLELYLAAFVWLVILWLLIALTIVEFYQLSETAALLLLPYLLWVTFAGYLNLMIFLLN